jgi:excisionase family DNA binding protein
MRGHSMPKKHLTTSEVAARFSVTPDSVLKWVKSGKIPALRTPGGHCRIPAEALSDFTASAVSRKAVASGDSHCWSYFAKDGEINRHCRTCVVYRSRTQWCWELQSIRQEIGHRRIHCKGSCDHCDFKRTILTIHTHNRKAQP